LITMTPLTNAQAQSSGQGRSGARSAPQEKVAWAPQPVELTPYTPPNRPLWKLADILKSHEGQKSWTQEISLSRDFHGQYIQMAPGEKTKTLFYADDRVFWMVQAGQVRFTIEGQDPFVASKGFLVQVPERVPYSLETVGDVPALFFQMTPAGEQPSYPLTETPPAVKGWKYTKEAYTGEGHYDQGPGPIVNRPYIDFNTEIVQGGKRIPVFIEDDKTYATIIRGPAPDPAPKPTELGHFHENFSEVWFVEEGQMELQVEGEPVMIGNQGDVLAAAPERWHRLTSYGPGMSTRIAIIPRPGNLHYVQPGGSGGGN
jgi:mannose-6-phosphate isomerase-like protein (cupin superfamily)